MWRNVCEMNAHKSWLELGERASRNLQQIPDAKSRDTNVNSLRLCTLIIPFRLQSRHQHCCSRQVVSSRVLVNFIKERKFNFIDQPYLGQICVRKQTARFKLEILEESTCTRNCSYKTHIILKSCEIIEAENKIDPA